MLHTCLIFWGSISNFQEQINIKVISPFLKKISTNISPKYQRFFFNFKPFLYKKTLLYIIQNHLQLEPFSFSTS